MDGSNPTTQVSVPLGSTGIDGTDSRRSVEETVDSGVSDDGFLFFPLITGTLSTQAHVKPQVKP